MAKKKKPEPKADIPRIRHLCSLGTLGGYGGKKGEWSAAKKLKQIRKAGFDGFLGRVHMLSAAEVQQSGLIFACTTDMGGPEDVEPKLTACKEPGARCVNVQMLDHDTDTVTAVTRARQVMSFAEKIELDVSIEVHRDTCTETPEKAYALAEGFEQAHEIVQGRCAMCHARAPAWDGLRWAPKGVLLETRADVARNARAIYLQAGVSHAMPPANITELPEEDRAKIVKWYRNAGTVDVVQASN